MKQCDFLNKKGCAIMKTDKIILRKFTINDAEKMFENWSSDSRVTKFLTWKPHTSLEESEKIIKQWINDDKNVYLSLIHISEPTRLHKVSRMPSSA